MAREKDQKLGAFIFVKSVPGKTKEVVTRLAAGSETKKTFDIEGIRQVFRTSGEWDAVAVVDADKIFDILDQINSFKGPNKLVAETSVVPCKPKQVGDP